MGKTEFTLLLILANAVLILFIIIIFGFVNQYRKRKMLHEKQQGILKEKYERELLAQRVAIQEETMADIGREIHDNVGQQLILASFYAESLKTNADKNTLEKLPQLINKAIEDLRSLSKSLTDKNIQQSSLDELIREEIKKIENLNSLKINYSTTENNGAYLNFKQKNEIFRIIQEFVQNSLKHSKATNIFIKTKLENNQFNLNLKDNGIGFNLQPNNSHQFTGIGLANMKKRAERINAEFEMQSAQQQGTELKLKLNNIINTQ